MKNCDYRSYTLTPWDQTGLQGIHFGYGLGNCYFHFFKMELVE